MVRDPDRRDAVKPSGRWGRLCREAAVDLPPLPDQPAAASPPQRALGGGVRLWGAGVRRLAHCSPAGNNALCAGRGHPPRQRRRRRAADRGGAAGR